MKKLNLAVIAAALTAIGAVAASALPLPAGTLAPAAGVPVSPFDDYMFVSDPGIGVLEELGATTADIDSCAGPNTLLARGGCLFRVPNAPGVVFKAVEDGRPTLVYDAMGLTVTGYFGLSCNDGTDCHLAFLSQIGNTPLDLSGINEFNSYSVNAVAGAAATVFDATYYLGDTYRRENPGVFARFVSINNIPEPTTLTLFGAGMLGAVAIRRRKKRG